VIQVELLGHCIDRFNERVKPGVERKVAQVELERLVAMCEAQPVRKPHRQEADLWLEIAPGIWLALVPHRTRKGWHMGITVLTNAGVSDERRAEINKRRAHKRARRRALRRKNNHVPEARRGRREEPRWNPRADAA
jgi:hypothetical protein